MLGEDETPDGNMTVTKNRVLVKTKEVLGLLTHHPLETKTDKELFQSMEVSVFRFSYVQVRWSQAELDQLQSLWLQAYKRAEYLANGTANDVFVFPKKWGSEELPTLVNIITQLCNNIRRCLVHNDVAKSITIQELQRAKDDWMCNTINELYHEMELWQWNAVQHNRWTRSLKASNRVGVRPMWYIDELEDCEKKLSWATTTRSLRKLKARIIKVGGTREQPQEQAWRLEDAAQWEFLFRGEEVFWKVAGAIRKAGYDSIFSLTQDPTKGGSSAPLLTREGGPGSRGTKHLRLLIPKGITGIAENERATLQAWLELVDWTGMGVLPNSQVPRNLKLNIDSASELHNWLTRKELQYEVKNHEPAQMFADNQRELKVLAEAIRNLDPNVESRVEFMSGGEVLGTALIMWLKNAEDEIEVARRVVKAVLPRMGTKRSQTHQEWAESCDTKMDLVTKIKRCLRTNSAR
jgi:hypothetical protein